MYRCIYIHIGVDLYLFVVKMVFSFSTFRVHSPLTQILKRKVALGRQTVLRLRGSFIAIPIKPFSLACPVGHPK